MHASRRLAPIAYMAFMALLAAFSLLFLAEIHLGGRSTSLAAAEAGWSVPILLAAALFCLAEFSLHGPRWALYGGLGLLLLLAAVFSVDLPNVLLSRMPIRFPAQGWALLYALSGLVFLVAARSTRDSSFRRRPNLIAIVVIGAFVCACLGVLVAEVPALTAQLPAAGLLVGGAASLAAGLQFRTRSGPDEPFFRWVSVALPLLAAADLQYAFRPFVPRSEGNGDVFWLAFLAVLLIALLAAAGRAHRQLGFHTRELSALDSLGQVPAVQETADVIQYITGVVESVLHVRARVLLAEEARSGDARPGLGDDVALGWEESSQSGQVAMGVPLRTSRRRLGVLVVTRADGSEFGREDARLLRALAAQVAFMLERSLLYEEVAAGAVLQERSRLAREIHDGLAQHLAFLKMRVAWLLRSNVIERPQLEDIEGVLETALVEARHAITTLRSGINTTGTVQAIADYAEEFGQVAHLEVHVDRSTVIPEPGPKTRVELLRVVQEALNNVRKHAAASAVRIAISSKDGWVHVVIADNGAGFTVDRSLRGHFGLEIMRERAESVGGRLDIRSEPSAGTQVTVTVPAGADVSRLEGLASQADPI